MMTLEQMIIQINIHKNVLYWCMGLKVVNGDAYELDYDVPRT